MNNAVGVLEGRDAELQRVALLHLIAVTRLPAVGENMSQLDKPGVFIGSKGSLSVIPGPRRSFGGNHQVHAA
jgi:hypothetical protein